MDGKPVCQECLENFRKDEDKNKCNSKLPMCVRVCV